MLIFNGLMESATVKNFRGKPTLSSWLRLTLVAASSHVCSEAYPAEELPLDDFEHGGAFECEFHDLPSLERPCFMGMKAFIDQEGWATLEDTVCRCSLDRTLMHGGTEYTNHRLISETVGREGGVVGFSTSQLFFYKSTLLYYEETSTKRSPEVLYLRYVCYSSNGIPTAHFCIAYSEALSSPTPPPPPRRKYT